MRNDLPRCRPQIFHVLTRWFVLCSLLLNASALSQELTPGRILTFEFPELPETLFNIGPFAGGKRVVPTLTASLPDDYTDGGTYPLLVYLEGGDGGTGTDIRSAQKAAGDKGFICVSLPLFKRARMHEEMYFGLLPTADDYQTFSTCFRTMLSRLLKEVPNIQKDRSTVGGWSNGGHFTALLVSASDEFLLEHFTQFFYGDGGFTLLAGNALHKPSHRQNRHLQLLADPTLPLGTRPSPDASLPNVNHRPPMFQIAQGVAGLAKCYGLNFQTVIMTGQAHGMTLPQRYFEVIGRWARGANVDDRP